jgi:hypothetical protein
VGHNIQMIFELKVLKDRDGPTVLCPGSAHESNHIIHIAFIRSTVVPYAAARKSPESCLCSVDVAAAAAACLVSLQPPNLSTSPAHGIAQLLCVM